MADWPQASTLAHSLEHVLSQSRAGGPDSLFQSLIDLIEDGVMVLDAGGAMFFGNPAAQRLLDGLSLTAAGTGRQGFFTEAGERLTAIAPVQQALRGQAEPQPVEVLARGLSSRTQGCWVRITARPLASAAPGLRDDFPGALCLIQDLTRERQQRVSQETSGRLYRLLFEQNLAGIIRSRVDGSIIECNQAFAKIIRLEDPSQVKAYRAASFYASEADRAANVAELARSGNYGREMRMRCVDGDLIWVLMRSTLVESPADEIGGEILTTVIEITEQKRFETTLRESEERFSTFMRNLPGMAFIKDPEGRYLYCNEAAQRVMGREQPNIVGAAPGQIWSKSFAAHLRRNDQRVIESGKPHEFIETVRHKDGVPHTWLVSKFPILDADGKPALVGGIGLDITERRNLEELLQQSLKMDAIGRLAGGVAHDFNNLLTVISGYGQMAIEALAGKQPVEKQRTYLDEILRAAERAAGLTGQLLSFSRRQVIQPRDLDLRKLVAQAERMLRRVIGEHIELQVAQPDTPCIVRADPGQLEQVLMNLTVNARDAMPDGGRLRIEITQLHRTTLAEPSGPCILLEIADTGKGMDRTTRARLFEPFFTSKLKGKGTGLGLATVYGIVKQCGGEILVDSELGKGARFSIYLPQAAGQADTEPRSKSRAKTKGGSESILLVEDEAVVRDLVRLMLTKNGYQVTDAGDAKEAIRIFQKSAADFDLLLTDVIMPHMNGRELATRLTAERPELRVIFMSGYTDDMLARHGVLAEDVLLLQKPFTPEALSKVVRAALDKKK
ncbi:MAG TPA: hybrid sensor histidine kinase/response regulator [Solibacterales bacterium]|nr:hybrid sensor histidine kinase/response regulator [Bryobacterales bacterium]